MRTKSGDCRCFVRDNFEIFLSIAGSPSMICSILKAVCRLRLFIQLNCLAAPRCFLFSSVYIVLYIVGFGKLVRHCLALLLYSLTRSLFSDGAFVPGQCKYVQLIQNTHTHQNQRIKASYASWKRRCVKHTFTKSSQRRKTFCKSSPNSFLARIHRQFYLRFLKTERNKHKTVWKLFLSSLWTV